VLPWNVCSWTWMPRLGTCADALAADKSVPDAATAEGSTGMVVSLVAPELVWPWVGAASPVQEGVGADVPMSVCTSGEPLEAAAYGGASVQGSMMGVVAAVLNTAGECAGVAAAVLVVSVRSLAFEEPA
jgi:hypothetical protein